MTAERQSQPLPAAMRSLLAITMLAGAACADLSADNTSANRQSAQDLRADQVTAAQGKDLAPEPESGRSSLDVKAGKIASGSDFMAVTANPHATDAAYAILSRGGSAIDAAVAAQAVLGLTEPQSSGLGGGGFMLYWDANSKRLFTYDGRETAPLKADENLFYDPINDQPDRFFNAVIGGKSVGVPGIVALLDEAQQAHGKLNWSTLFDDAINLAENGFEVSPRLNILLNYVPKVAERDAIATYLFDEDRKPLPVGHRIKNPAYAKTLKQLAAGRGRDFYSGDLAREMVAAVNADENRGELSMQDFQSYKVKQRPAVCKQLFGYRVCGMGPPSSGGMTTLQILGILSQLEEQAPSGSFVSMTDNIETAHQYISASQLAFADRNTYIADPDFIAVPIDGLLANDYLKSRAQLIDAVKALNEVKAGQPPGSSGAYIQSSSPELMSTTHLSIVDSDGNAVSMTSSIETAFGSRLMVGGFILNNQLTDFSFAPYDSDKTLIANRVQGGKRPRSSMSPMIVFDQSGHPVLVIGSPGGKKIIGYVARTLYEVLAHNRALDASIKDLHVLHMGSRLELEKGISEAFSARLQALGHQPVNKAQTSGLHAIQRQGKGWIGVADPRREGTARGQ